MYSGEGHIERESVEERKGQEKTVNKQVIIVKGCFHQQLAVMDL